MAPKAPPPEPEEPAVEDTEPPPPEYPADKRGLPFPDFLDATGVAQELQALLLELYKEPIRPEAPDDVKRWVEERYGVATVAECERLQSENEVLGRQSAVLEQERDQLKEQVEELREDED